LRVALWSSWHRPVWRFHTPSDQFTRGASAASEWDLGDGRFDRYYDPSTDQFLSVDPDLAETGQPYAFTGDDPLNATDPLGLISTPRTWTRKTLPKVDDVKLRNILRNNLWKYDPEGHVGNGSSVAAVEREAETGKPTKGSFHETTLANAKSALEDVLDNPGLSAGDREVATATYTYVSGALQQFDVAVVEEKIPIGNGPEELNPVRGSQAVNRFGSYLAQVGAGENPLLPPGSDASGGATDPDPDGLPDI
jgi:RHS repeat-associated protein